MKKKVRVANPPGHFHRDVVFPRMERPAAADMLEIERRTAALSTGSNVRAVHARVAKIKALYNSKVWTSRHASLWRRHNLYLNAELVGASLATCKF